MSNYMDENTDETFSDQPDEIHGQESEPVRPTLANTPAAPQPAYMGGPKKQNYEVGLSPGSNTTAEEELGEDEDFSEVLNDASLRLEQGQLYKLIMNTDLFNEGDADPKAIKNVQREIRQFAKERMEVMLGMRQETPKESANAFPMESFPFNALEVEVLKSLAATATKGQTVNAPAFSAGPKQAATLNKVSTQRTNKVQQSKPLSSRPSKPVQRTARQAEIEQILREEGVTMEEIDEVFDPNRKYYKDRKEFVEQSTEEIIDRNRRASATKTVASSTAMPMPTQEQIDAMYTARANQAASHPQMQTIMNLLANRKPNP